MSSVFKSQEAFDEVYEEYLENRPMASQQVKDSYKRMGEAFNEYLNAVQEDEFRYIYECGYEAGKREANK